MRAVSAAALPPILDGQRSGGGQATSAPAPKVALSALRRSLVHRAFGRHEVGGNILDLIGRQELVITKPRHIRARQNALCVKDFGISEFVFSKYYYIKIYFLFQLS